MLMIDEIELLCLSIEGGLATSTPEFIQDIIDSLRKRKNKDAIGVQSLIKRLENIKKELEVKDVKNS